MNPYLPVVIAVVGGAVFALGMVLVSWLLGPHRPNARKKSTYECGVPLVTDARERFNVKFYLTAILFLLFDVETIFLYLWAVTFRSLGWFGVIEVFIFIGVLLAGYVYVVKRGALEWE